MHHSLPALSVSVLRVALLLAAVLVVVVAGESGPAASAQTPNAPFAPENYVLTVQTGLGSTPGQLVEITPTATEDNSRSTGFIVDSVVIR